MPTRRLQPHLTLAVVLTAGAGVVLLLRLVPPETSLRYPLCPIHLYTGLLCPGCGATRAFAALVRGQLAEALHLNPLALIALLGAAAIALFTYIRALQGHPRPWPRIPPPAIAAALAATAIFTVLRNLP